MAKAKKRSTKKKSRARAASTGRPTRKKTAKKTARKAAKKTGSPKAAGGRRRAASGSDELTLGAWRVPKSLLQRLNAAAYWKRKSAAALVRESLEGHLGKMEKANGQPFPAPPGER